MRALVVEDHADVADWLAAELLLRGADVRVAHDGFEALVRLAQFDPDLMLVDIALPRMNGWALARRVRGLLGSCAPRLIAISALAEAAHIEQSRIAGFEQHLVKPIRPQQLEAVLARVARA